MPEEQSQSPELKLASFVSLLNRTIEYFSSLDCYLSLEKKSNTESINLEQIKKDISQDTFNALLDALKDFNKNFLQITARYSLSKASLGSQKTEEISKKFPAKSLAEYKGILQKAMGSAAEISNLLEQFPDIPSTKPLIEISNKLHSFISKNKESLAKKIQTQEAERTFTHDPFEEMDPASASLIKQMLEEDQITQTQEPIHRRSNAGIPDINTPELTEQQSESLYKVLNSHFSQNDPQFVLSNNPILLEILGQNKQEIIEAINSDDKEGYNIAASLIIGTYEEEIEKPFGYNPGGFNHTTPRSRADSNDSGASGFFYKSDDEEALSSEEEEIEQPTLPQEPPKSILKTQKDITQNSKILKVSFAENLTETYYTTSSGVKKPATTTPAINI